MHETDAATLVAAHVQHHAAPLGGHLIQRRVRWGPQSQRSEPKTSPVRHSECTRTSTSSPSPRSPITSANESWPVMVDL